MLYILCGIPGSGKTIYSRTLARQLNAKLYCYDDIPQSSNPSKFEALHGRMWADILDDLRSNNAVVCDDLHTTKKQRIDILNAVKEVDCRKTLIVMNTPLEECIIRNANRKDRLPDCILTYIHKTFEPPDLSEGWSEILYLNRKEESL